MISQMVLSNAEFLCKNRKISLNGREANLVVNKLATMVMENGMSHHVVTLLESDSLWSFMLTLALEKCDCVIMFVDVRNGREICERIIKYYAPDFVIVSEDDYKKYNISHNMKDLSVENHLYKWCQLENNSFNKMLCDKYPGSFIFFSSGTTGMPKAVLRTRIQMLEDARNNETFFLINGNEKVLVLVPFGHVYGCGSGVLPYALQGARIVFAENMLTGRKIKKYIEEENISVIIGNPVYYQMMLPMDINCGNVKIFLSAGGAISEKTGKGFIEKYGKPLNNMYGSSETGGITTLLKSGEVWNSSDVGSVLNGVEVKCDTDGTVCVKSLALAEGYIDKENAMVKKIVNEDGWYRSNDVGFWNKTGVWEEDKMDRHLFLAGRNDDMINVGGEKINPKTIEDEFVDDFDEVLAAAERDTIGEYPVLYYVGGYLDTEVILNRVEKVFPVRYMPRKIYSVDAFIRNKNGKIVRRELQYSRKVRIDNKKSCITASNCFRACILNCFAEIGLGVGEADIYIDGLGFRVAYHKEKKHLYTDNHKSTFEFLKKNGIHFEEKMLLDAKGNVEEEFAADDRKSVLGAVCDLLGEEKYIIIKCDSRALRHSSVFSEGQNEQSHYLVLMSGISDSGNIYIRDGYIPGISIDAFDGWTDADPIMQAWERKNYQCYILDGKKYDPLTHCIIDLSDVLRLCEEYIYSVPYGEENLIYGEEAVKYAFEEIEKMRSKHFEIRELVLQLYYDFNIGGFINGRRLILEKLNQLEVDTSGYLEIISRWENINLLLLKLGYSGKNDRYGKIYSKAMELIDDEHEYICSVIESMKS